MLHFEGVGPLGITARRINVLVTTFPETTDEALKVAWRFALYSTELKKLVPLFGSDNSKGIILEWRNQKNILCIEIDFEGELFSIALPDVENNFIPYSFYTDDEKIVYTMIDQFYLLGLL